MTMTDETIRCNVSNRTSYGTCAKFHSDMAEKMGSVKITLALIFPGLCMLKIIALKSSLVKGKHWFSFVH